jgi:hypothetical protein
MNAFLVDQAAIEGHGAPPAGGGESPLVAIGSKNYGYAEVTTQNNRGVLVCSDPARPESHHWIGRAASFPPVEKRSDTVTLFRRSRVVATP